MERDIYSEISLILKSEISAEELRERLADYHDNDIAIVIHDLEKEERLKIYPKLGEEKVSEIFSYLDDVEDFIEEVGLKKAADIIELMDSDDAIDVLEELDEEDRIAIIEEMDEEIVEDINLITQYEEDEIGSIMTTNYILINKNYTIKEAMKSMVSQAADNDNVSIIFVSNNDETYYGSIDLRDLIITRYDKNLDDIIKTSYPVLHATDLISDCINDLKEYSLELYPVLDNENKLIGVITSNDIVETVDEELTDDYAKLAGLTETDELDEKTIVSVKKRIPWLVILVAMGLGVSLLISSFEDVVKSIPMIVFFQSLILGMAGNTGTQSLAVTIRTISNEELNKTVIFKMIFKEIKIGFLNGLIIGSLSFLILFGFLYLTKTEVIPNNGFIMLDALKVCGSVSISLLGAMLMSSVIGTFMPLFFKKINIDPAVASGPFITTIIDIISIIIYYGLASLLFNVLL